MRSINLLNKVINEGINEYNESKTIPPQENSMTENQANDEILKSLDSLSKLKASPYAISHFLDKQTSELVSSVTGRKYCGAWCDYYPFEMRIEKININREAIIKIDTIYDAAFDNEDERVYLIPVSNGQYRIIKKYGFNLKVINLANMNYHQEYAEAEYSEFQTDLIGLIKFVNNSAILASI